MSRSGAITDRFRFRGTRMRAFLGIFGIACALLNPAHASGKRNVLFISVDDLNDYISPLGGFPGVKTPNFDRLASMGVMFTNAHTPSPVCGPARCAVMTGLLPHVTGVYSNDQDDQVAVRKVGGLNQEFLENGYFTAGVGKVYHNFEFVEGDWSESKRMRNWPDADPGDISNYAGGFKDVGSYPDEREADTADYKAVSWAIERLEATRDEPFFIACGIYRPHTPWTVPQKYFELFPLESIEVPAVVNNIDDMDDIPDFGLLLAHQRFNNTSLEYSTSFHADISDAGDGKVLIQAYLASMAYADAQLGRLLDAYEGLDPTKRDNTLLVLWSDHGWHLGEKARWRKSTLWEEATRVPFFLILPGVTEPGTVIDRPVGLIDLYPTLRDYCELDSDRALCGDSLRPLLESADTNEWRDTAFTVYKEKSITVRTPDFRFIRYPDGGEEFYDHRIDPGERNNLIAEPSYAADIAETRSLLPSLQDMEDPLDVDAEPGPPVDALAYEPRIEAYESGMRVQFTRQRLDDVVEQLEVSLNLETWEDAEVGVEYHPDDVVVNPDDIQEENVILRLLETATENPQFFRIRIEPDL
jgi:arylsulfatase A-like enzyme